jgi:hypothetical protein
MSASEREVSDEIFDARWDRTEKLLQDREGSRWKRRLDSIARLIENNSTCAAIAIEGNSFLIATNKEFPRGENTQDQGYLLIDAVMSYFKAVSAGIDNKEQFQAIFKQICDCAMSGLQLLKYVREELGGDDFIQRILVSGQTQDFRGLRDYISENAELGHFPKDAGAAFVVCHALLQDFNKVIKYIRDNKDKAPDDSPTARFIQAIKNYNEKNIIDQLKLKDKVADTSKMHAEMRLICLIDEKLKNKEKEYENYIGISKLCCLDCHCIIHGINQAAGYNNRIEIRGAHNVSHSGNWRAPFNITGQQPLLLEAPKVAKDLGVRISKANSVPDAFASAVLEKYKAARQAAGSGARDVSEYHESSQHSGDEDEERLIYEVLDELETEYTKLKQINIPGIRIDESVFKAIERLLKDLQDKDTLVRNWVLGGEISNILGYIRSLNDNEDITTLNSAANVTVAILRDPRFVGRTISEKFSSIAKTILKFHAEKKTHDEDPKGSSSTMSYEEEGSPSTSPRSLSYPQDVSQADPAKSGPVMLSDPTMSFVGQSGSRPHKVAKTEATKDVTHGLSRPLSLGHQRDDDALKSISSGSQRNMMHQFHQYQTSRSSKFLTIPEEEQDIQIAIWRSLNDFSTKEIDADKLFGLTPYDVDYKVGNCLFDAIRVSDSFFQDVNAARVAAISQLQSDPELQERLQVVISQNEDKLRLHDGSLVNFHTPEEYIQHMLNDKTWGTYLETVALSRALQRPIVIFSQSFDYPHIVELDNYQGNEPIFIQRIGEHYRPMAVPTGGSSVEILAEIRSHIENRGILRNSNPIAKQGLEKRSN